VLVVLDACVLYPPSLRDLLLTLAALDAFDVRWSEAILEELHRNVVADNPQLDAERFRSHTLAEMTKHFPEAMVAVGPSDIDGRLDNDPKDRHVAAVAIVSHAAMIVTMNVKDFQGKALETAGVAVITPGQLVEGLLDEAPELVVFAVQRMASRWKQPPRSPAQVVEILTVHPTMATAMARADALVR
jgi:predicted nucleic acid-binding protein